MIIAQHSVTITQSPPTGKTPLPDTHISCEWQRAFRNLFGVKIRLQRTGMDAIIIHDFESLVKQAGQIAACETQRAVLALSQMKKAGRK